MAHEKFPTLVKFLSRNLCVTFLGVFVSAGSCFATFFALVTVHGMFFFFESIVKEKLFTLLNIFFATNPTLSF